MTANERDRIREDVEVVIGALKVIAERYGLESVSAYFRSEDFYNVSLYRDGEGMTYYNTLCDQYWDVYTDQPKKLKFEILEGSKC